MYISQFMWHWYVNISDVVLDVDTLTDEQLEQLNACGTQFGMGKKDYIK